MHQDARAIERRTGLTIAVFAALLATNDLFGTKFADDQILGANERANAFAWYQSKSTKQSLVQHQLDLVKLLPAPTEGVVSAALAPADDGARAAQLQAWESEIARYDREKREILQGSAAVGPEGWALQDDRGELGHIYGALRWGATIERLDAAGNAFDVGSLFLQLTLVLGAVSLVVQETKLKARYYWAMLALGAVGSTFGALGLAVAVGAITV